jgi:DNA-binding Lrp family transcriptional regulator
MKRIDHKDITLLNILQKDARTKLRSLADSLSLTTSPTHDRILLLLRDGYISNFKAVINRQQFGYRYRAFVWVELAVDITAFESAIACFHEVELAYQLTGSAFMLLVHVKNEKAYSQFVVNRLRALVNDFKTYPVTREVKTFARLDHEDIKASSKRPDQFEFVNNS